jgi:hypothetical protein
VQQGGISFKRSEFGKKGERFINEGQEGKSGGNPLGVDAEKTNDSHHDESEVHPGGMHRPVILVKVIHWVGDHSQEEQAAQL